MPETDELRPPPVAEHFPPTADRSTFSSRSGESRPRAQREHLRKRGADPGAGPRTPYLPRRDVTDENSGDEEKPVQVARRTFRLLFEDEFGAGTRRFGSRS